MRIINFFISTHSDQNEDLQAGPLLSYQAIKSAEEGVHDIFNFNRQNFQLYAELVDETYANHKKTMKQLKDHIR